MLNFGTTSNRLSSVTVPMRTTVLFLCSSAACSLTAVETIREIDMGGRLMRDMKRRRRTVLLNFDSVRPDIINQFGSQGLDVALSR